MADISLNQKIDWKNITLEHPEFVNSILNNKYIPHKPFKNQFKFLIYPAEEILYGGAAGRR